MPEINRHITQGGWTIETYRTSAKACAEVSGLHVVSIADVRRRMNAQRLPPAPQITPKVAAIMSKPLPVVPAVNPVKDGTDAELIQLCDLSIRVQHDFETVDAVTGGTLYEPPASFAAYAEALREVAWSAHLAAAAIPAVSSAGIRAKGRVIAAFMNPEWSSLDGHPIVTSLLADCAALSA